MPQVRASAGSAAGTTSSATVRTEVRTTHLETYGQVQGGLQGGRTRAQPHAPAAAPLATPEGDTQRRPCQGREAAPTALQRRISSDPPATTVTTSTVTMSTKVVDTKVESGEIKTALLTPSPTEGSGKNGSHAPAATAVVVVESSADGDNVQEVTLKSKKLVHIKARMSEELSNNAMAKWWIAGLIHLVGLTIPYLAILVGAVYLDECPANRNIPFHLIIAGVILAILHISSTIDMHRKLSYLDSDEEKKPAILTVISIFMFIWMICGCVWTFGIYWPEYYQWSLLDRGYCNYLLYWFAFWFNIITLVAWVVSWIVCCCVCGFLCNTTILSCPSCLCLPYQKHSSSEKEEEV